MLLFGRLEESELLLITVRGPIMQNTVFLDFGQNDILILIKKIPALIVCSIPTVIQFITSSPNFSKKVSLYGTKVS